MQDILLSHQTPFVVIIAISLLFGVFGAVIGLIAITRMRKMRHELDIIFTGKKARDLEDVILHSKKRIAEFDTEIQELFNISNTINKQAHKSINKVGLVRFDPFKDYSGNQSFALALLNSKKDGIVMSSIHTREGTRIYAKDVENGAALKHELTEEEKDAISRAQ